MKITVYSSKGSAGKTPIAANIAFDRDYAIGTNEPFDILEDVFPDDRLLSVQADEPFPTLPDDIDIVFDLAGSLSKTAQSIRTAIEQSDLVIVPVFNEIKSRKSAIGTLGEVERFNQSILIVATKLKGQKNEVIRDWKKCRDFQQIEADIRANIETPYPILPLKFSTAFDAIFEHEMSIAEIRKHSPLLAHSFSGVCSQFDAIYHHIDQIT